MIKHKNNFRFVLCVLLVVIITVECRRFGGSAGRAPSRGSSGHSGWSTPSRSSSGSGHTSSGSGTNYGWSRPSTNTGSNTGTNTGWSRPNTNTGSNTGTNYGWKSPSTNTQTHTGQGSSQNNYGWKPSNTQTGSAPTGGGWQKPNNNPASPQTGGGSQTGTNYGWKPPNSQTHTNPGGAQTGGTNYGFQKPNTNPASPGGTNYGWKKPDNTPHQTAGVPNNNFGKSTQTHVNNPYPKSGSAGSGYQHSNAPSANIGPKGYPVQQGSHKYNTGYNNGYQQGYSRGYQNAYQSTPAAHPSSYGFSQSYYPNHNNYGYPGQGIFGGAHGPSYGGMSVFGNNGHYGYPSSGSWGYPSYGTGSSGSTTKGILIGAVGGYYLNSLLHSHSSPSNHWGYSGSGYGSQYGHVTVDRRTIINNHYNNQTTENSGKDDSIPGNWIQCIAFDPTTQSTLINPNCSCTVTVQTDPGTNVSSSLHNCSTTYGYQTEKTPTGLPGRYAPNIETFDSRYASPQAGMPEKYINGTSSYTVVDLKEQRKKEFFLQLEKIVNMGKFAS